MTRRADIIIGLVLGGVAAYVLYETRSYPPPLVPGSLGAAAFPRLLAWMLLLLSALLVVSGARRPPAPAPPATHGETTRTVGALLITLAFTVLFEQTDAFLLLPLLLASIMILMGDRRIGVILAIPVIFDVFVYVVFYRLFGVLLPSRFL